MDSLPGSPVSVHRIVMIPLCAVIFASLGNAPVALAGVFEPDVYGNGMSLDQYMRPVPGGGQPNGPAYDFWMGKYEITNAQYAAFLNDAQLDGGATGKGSNMFFLDSGEVRLSENGLTMFLTSGVFSGIQYNPSVAVGERYYVHSNSGQIDYSPFPASRISLLGAMKFCNWLTLDQGLGESQRVYHEGSTLQDWHPMSISKTDYTTRDLNAAERQNLVDNYRGFRVPMDNQTTTASAYNEFYKAAAWDSIAQVNRTFGMGRDTIDNRDANGYGLHPDYDPKFPTTIDDPFESDQDIQKTPVGFYDGTNWQRSQWNWPLPWESFQTRANLNSYGIYDLSGNVMEWMQDRNQQPSILHALRGGSFEYPRYAIQNTFREGHFPSIASSTYGMRIVQTPEPGSLHLLVTGLFLLLSGRRRRRFIIDRALERNVQWAKPREAIQGRSHFL